MIYFTILDFDILNLLKYIRSVVAQASQPRGYAIPIGTRLPEMNLEITNSISCLNPTKVESIITIGAVVLPEPLKAADTT